MMKNSVMYMLEENAERCPEKTAIADEQRKLTYLQYLDMSVALAGEILHNPLMSRVDAGEGALEDTGAAGDDSRVRCRPIGVWIDRNILSIAAFMGIAYSGNFYVPLDPALPAGRLSVILDELCPLMLLDARETGGELPVQANVPVIDVREFFDRRMEEGTQDLPEVLSAAKALRSGIIDTDPLYAIFTSGSTGVPKGVLVAHRSVMDLTEAFAEAFGFEEDSVFGNQAPFDFDVSVKDIYNALHCCGTVEIVPHRMFVMPAMLMEYLAVRGINTIIWAVSALRIVSDLRALDKMETSVPVALRRVMFSGEVMPVKCVNYWMKFFPDAVFVNLYGPTEITCNCTYHVLEGEYEPDSILPIGRAFPNTRVFLLETGEDGKTLPDARIIPSREHDVRGEICVEGTGVALGYWNNPERTAESFTAKNGEPATLNKIYRTGDLGYYNSRGILCFAARADNQIKHMGHRIELGEIEAALNAIGFIDVACCIYDQKREKIVCFYQADKDMRREIIAALSEKLPKYMRPNKYIQVKTMPLNAHAKIDRRQLREMM